MRCREYIHITVNVLNVVVVSVLQQLLDEGVTALTHIQAEAIFPQLEFSGTVSLFDSIVCCLMALKLYQLSHPVTPSYHVHVAFYLIKVAPMSIP